MDSVQEGVQQLETVADSVSQEATAASDDLGCGSS